MKNIEINVEQLRQDMEHAFDMINKTAHLEGERSGLLLAGVEQKQLGNYDDMISMFEKERDLAIDAVKRHFDGEEL